MTEHMVGQSRGNGTGDVGSWPVLVDRQQSGRFRALAGSAVASRRTSGA
jgi:hypothetical protein